MPDTKNKLIQGRLLARNTIMNLIGYGTPLFVAIFTIPILIRELGSDRFGVLTLVWILISYIGLLDLGLGRALIKMVAEKLGNYQNDQLPSLIWTGLTIICLMGVIVGGASAAVLPWLVNKLMNIPLNLQKETINSFYMIAGFVPVIVISVALRGILDAHQRFDLTNMVRIPLGIFTFLAPVVVLPFSVSLFHIVTLLLIGRMLACIIQAIFCFHIVPSLGNKVLFESQMARGLLKFGGWMTITNIISPAMIYIDRFFISGIISVAAVTYYATPGEIVTKLTLISGAMMAVFFPAFSSIYMQDKNRTAILFAQCVKYIYIIIFPFSLLMVILSYEGLSTWLTPGFAENSAPVMQFLSIGVLFLCLGQAPFALIQGAGRPDLTAIIHLIEIPFYIVALFFFTKWYGIKGTAIAWSARLFIDSAIMFYIALQMLQKKIEDCLFVFVVVLLTGVLSLAAFMITELLIKILFICLFLPLYLIFTWSYILNFNERGLLKEKGLKMYHRCFLSRSGL